VGGRRGAHPRTRLPRVLALAAVTRCADCGTELAPDEPERERQPCPKCGSLKRNYELDASPAEYRITGSPIGTRVERAVTETRMTAFALIFATALGVGLAAGFATSLWVGVLAFFAGAVATALLLAAIYRVGAIRHVAMELMRRITGQ
jgi:predicted RNA-binding Zn-ribbon protein involved in translation (DUF1610 family)